MSTESDIRACLLTLAGGTTGTGGAIVGGRVYFSIVPLEVLKARVFPIIRLSIVAITPDNTVWGAADLDDYRVQIDAFHSSYGSLVTLRGQIFTAIETKFPYALRLNDMTDYDADLKIHRRIIEYQLTAA